MTRHLRLSLILFALLVIVGSIAAAQSSLDSNDDAQSPGAESQPRLDKRYGDLVSVFSGDLHVPAGQDRRGMVVAVGADVLIEGRVSDVIVVMGNLEIRDGQVRNQVVGVLSELDLQGAEIGDQLVNVLGPLHRVDTFVDGQTVNVSLGNWFPGVTALFFWFRLLGSFASFIVIVLMVALVPERVQLIGDEVGRRYVAAFFVGILGYLGALVAFTLLAATIIGVPIAIFAFWALKWLGIAGLFYAMGRRIGRGLGREMSILGAVLITFTVYVAMKLLPLPLGPLGLIFSAMLWMLFLLLIEIPAIGMVILTRIGTSGTESMLPRDPFVVPANPPSKAAPRPPAAAPSTPSSEPPGAAPGPAVTPPSSVPPKDPTS